MQQDIFHIWSVGNQSELHHYNEDEVGDEVEGEDEVEDEGKDKN